MERRLGRGLSSLLQMPVEENPRNELEIASISPNPFQPRKTMDPSALEELRDSIRIHGLLQPVVVRKSGSSYQLVSGERRWRAARLAGLERIPVVVRENVSDDDMLELAMVENVQRRDLNPIERAQGYRSLMQRLSLTQEQVAEKVGLKRSSVANHVRLLELPSEVQEAVGKGLVSMGHARALLGSPQPVRMLEMLEQIVRKDLSVRDVERMVRDDLAPKPAAASEPATPSRPSWLVAAEQRLRSALATKVALKSTPECRGSITIDFYSQTDFERLLNHIAPRPTI